MKQLFHPVSFAFRRGGAAHPRVEPHGGDGRRRDDEDHLAPHQEEAHHAVRRHQVPLLRPVPAKQRRHRRPGPDNPAFISPKPSSC